jgi:hypothetical protein
MARPLPIGFHGGDISDQLRRARHFAGVEVAVELAANFTSRRKNSAFFLFELPGPTSLTAQTQAVAQPSCAAPNRQLPPRYARLNIWIAPVNGESGTCPSYANARSDNRQTSG